MKGDSPKEVSQLDYSDYLLPGGDMLNPSVGNCSPAP